MPAIETDSVGTPGWLSWLSTQLLILAQVMISSFVRSSPTLTVQGLLGIVSLPLSLPHPPTLKINK